MSASPYYGVYPLVAGKGTSGRPSVTFVNDYRTGIYSPAEGVLAITSEGGEVVRFGSADISLPGSVNLRLYDSDNTNYVGFKSPDTVSTNVTFTLPGADGSSGQVLTTGGNGVLSWSSATDTLSTLTPADGSIVIGNGTEFVTESGSVARSSLGLSIGVDIQSYDGNTAKTNITQTFTAGQRGVVTTLISSATLTPNFASGNNFSVTLNQNALLNTPTNLVAGQSGCIWVIQDGVGGRTLSYGSVWKFEAGSNTSLTTTANAVNCIVYSVLSPTHITAALVR